MRPVLLFVMLLGLGGQFASAHASHSREAGLIKRPVGIKKLQPPLTRVGLEAAKTPDGLEACTQPIPIAGSLSQSLGETIRYIVDVDGLSVGTVDFKAVQRGSFNDALVTEYRSHFKIDSLVSAIVSVEGRAASLVPLDGQIPVRAMNRYRIRKNQYEEEVVYDASRNELVSNRSRNGKRKRDVRHFVVPARDFIAGFYFFRTLPRDVNGCTVIYGNQRAYTIWISPDGQEKVKTPVGLRLADRYTIRYASERFKKPRTGRVWVSVGPDRLPYRAELDGKHSLLARIHLYEPGSGS